MVRDGWDYFEDVGSESEVALVMKTLKKTGALPGIDKHSPAAIWSAIEAVRSGETLTHVSEADIKEPEWEALTDPNRAHGLAAFSQQTGVRSEWFREVRFRCLAARAAAGSECATRLHASRSPGGIG